MKIWIFIFLHVIVVQSVLVSNPELLVVETDDGIVYGIDSSQGTSIWSIITGPPLISSSSFIDGIDIHITQEGFIYFVDHTNSASLKLSQTIYDIIHNGPLRLAEIPDAIIYGDKNTKLFTVNAFNGEFSEELINEDVCPYEKLSFSQSLLLGRIDYSIFGINEITNQMMWNLTFSKFTSFSTVQTEKYLEIDSLNVIEDDKLIAKSGENTLWTKNFSNNIRSLHGYVPGKYTLENLNLKFSYFDENLATSHHYSEYLIIFFLLIFAMSIGFYFGRQYVTKKQVQEISPVNIKYSPVHSRKNSEAEKCGPLCVVQENNSQNFLDFMKNRTMTIDSFVEQKMFEPKIVMRDLGPEKKVKSELEVALIKGPEGMIKTETHIMTTTYDENSNDDTIFFAKVDASKEDQSSSFDVNTFPPGEFSQIISILDNGNYKKKFVFERVLGYGGFSTVHLAKHKLDDQLYAIKIVRMKIAEKEQLTNHKLFAEVNAIKTLQSKYVVRYITCWVEIETSNLALQLMDESSFDSSSDLASSERSSVTLEKFMPVLLHIQMEYCQGMTLKEWIDNSERVIDRKKNYVFFYQICKGIQHIHERGIIHRDLKPANIFIDGEENLKIGDFNLATFLLSSSGSTTSSSRHLQFQRRSVNIGTPLYLAPEQETSNYDNKVDIFPLGLVLLELCFKFSTYHELSRLLKQIRNEHTLPKELLESFPIESKIILWLTSKNPQDRPDTSELLRDNIMKQWKQEVGFG